MKLRALAIPSSHICGQNTFPKNNFSSDVNECELFPCQNGGTCRNSNGGYVCECMPGWEGKDCENGE